MISPIAKIVSLAKCNAYKKRVNGFWPIGNNSMGSFILNPESKIKFVCEKYLQKLQQTNPPESVENQTFDILLCGDGVSITKTHLKTLNFTFTLLNDRDLSSNGFYSLGIFKIVNEDYESIKMCLEELIEKLRIISHMELENTKYNIVFYSGGDLKWMANVFGINAANSNFPCLWCKWQNKKNMKIEDIERTWSIGGRSHSDALNFINKKEPKGYVKVGLLPFIAFERNVVDILHLTLRITDKLFSALLFRLEELDGNNTADLNERLLTKIFSDFIEIECNVTYPFYKKDEEDKKSILKLRKLNQNERMIILDKLFENRSLCSIFPEKYRKDLVLMRLNRLFYNFKDIINDIKKDYSQGFEKNILESKLKKWLKDYLNLEKNITPYIHILCFHIPEFIQKFKYLNLYSMQGMEKKNHFSKINFFRQTNHHKNSFTTILLEKINRLDFINLNGNLD